MCHLPPKIKFCSCTTPVDNSKNSWTLHRFNKHKDLLIMGEPAFPAHWFDLHFEATREALLNRLNEPDAFGTPIKFRNEDTLEVWIKGTTEWLQYCFRYCSGKWRNDECCPFELVSRFDDVSYGKVESGSSL